MMDQGGSGQDDHGRGGPASPGPFPGGAEVWERHAEWWQAGFTGGADAEYTEQILPLIQHHLAGATRVLDVGTGEGQVARLAAEGGRLVIGLDPAWAQLSEAGRRSGAGPGSGPGPASGPAPDLAGAASGPGPASGPAPDLAGAASGPAPDLAGAASGPAPDLAGAASGPAPDLAGARPAYVQAVAGALPMAAASFDAVVACLVFEHIGGVDAAIAEVARVLRPGGRFLFLLNHPLLQTPGSGWIDDHILEEQYWRIGPYLVEDETLEEVDKGVFIPFVHRPLSRYVNAMASHGLAVVRMEEPAPPAGFVARAREYREAATIPRLLLLRAEKAWGGVAWGTVAEL